MRPSIIVSWTVPSATLGRALAASAQRTLNSLVRPSTIAAMRMGLASAVATRPAETVATLILARASIARRVILPSDIMVTSPLLLVWCYTPRPHGRGSSRILPSGVIDQNGEDDDRALDDLLVVRGDPHKIEAVIHDANNKRSNQCVGHRANASRQACSTNHNGRNCVELIAETGLWQRSGYARSENGTGEPSERAHHDIDREHHCVDVDSARLGASRIPADRVDPAPIDRKAQHDPRKQVPRYLAWVASAK